MDDLAALAGISRVSLTKYVSGSTRPRTKTVGGTTVKHYMTQLQLSELLKDTDIILLSVNAPTVKRYRRKKR